MTVTLRGFGLADRTYEIVCDGWRQEGCYLVFWKRGRHWWSRRIITAKVITSPGGWWVSPNDADIAKQMGVKL